VGATSYSYDANGNMLTDDNGTVTTTDDRTIIWDVENRPKSIAKDGVTTTFVYDGDGNRVKQTVGGVTTTYVNKYFEKTGDNVTTSYYLGSKLIAVRTGTTLSYILQDHLGSTSGSANSSGALASTLLYYSFGATRASTGTSPTGKKFTGQRLDSTGLYYYNARYYDPSIGRFISPDSIVPDWKNPQTWNKYSYVLNNPLKYTDESGHILDTILDVGFVVWDVVELVRTPSWENAGTLGVDVVCALIPFATGGGLVIKGVKNGDNIFKVLKDVASQVNNIKDAWKMGIKNPWSFRGKLQKLTGMSDKMAKGMEAHHILPQALEDKFISRFGNDFDINNPFWGTWVKKGEHQKWSYQYQKDWEEWLNKNPKARIEEVMKKAEELGTKYDFKVNWAE
jgi:RHS repeat-associated protein